MPATSQTAENRYNERSFFFDCNIDSPVLNTWYAPNNSIMNHIVSSPSFNTTNTFASLVNRDWGITGEEPATPCTEPPTINEGDEFAKMSFTFGRINRKTQTKETSKLIELACQRAFDDFFFVGSTEMDLMNMSMSPSSSERDLIREGAVRRQMSALRQRLYREMATQVWAGDSANDVGTGYKEMRGLTSLVSADYGTDATLVTLESGVQADGAILNSELLDFGGVCVGGDTSPILYEYLYEMADTIDSKAFYQGVEASEVKIVMRRQLWGQIVKHMFSEMAADGVTTGTINVTDGSNGMQAVQARNALYNSRRLMLNGKLYEVIFDDFIPMTAGTDGTTGRPYNQSDIYFLTTRVSGVGAGGSIDTLRMQYRNYMGIEPALGPANQPSNDAKGWTDGGRYHFIIEELRRCFQVDVVVEPQLQLLAPHLCGRIQNVRTCDLMTKPTPNTNP